MGLDVGGWGEDVKPLCQSQPILIWSPTCNGSLARFTLCRRADVIWCRVHNLAQKGYIATPHPPQKQPLSMHAEAHLEILKS